MKLTFTRDQLLLLFDAWWLTFSFLVITGYNQAYILSVMGFISVALLPGVLTLRALPLPRFPLGTALGMAVGFSIVELIVMGLIGNLLLPLVGISRPLDPAPLLGEITLLVGVLATVCWYRMKNETLVIEIFKGWGGRDLLLAFLPSIFVLASIVGAFTINAGGSSTITLTMLIGCGLYSAVLLYYSRRAGSSVIPIALYFIALALLLMTSLRGYAIVGHDIQNEFRVFELARSAGFWSIATYQDAYNACMSITILPTIFANLMALKDPYVYKAVFQVIFALVPSLVYLLVRRYVSAPIAFLSVIYFVAFPTFFTDMPFLNRQEIAFLFLSLMFLTVFEDRIAYRARQSLFLLFGLGMILSHYSTTYTVIGVLLLLVVTRPFAMLVGKVLPRWLSHTTIAAVHTNTLHQRPSITWWMAGLLIAVSFFWSSVFTDTSSNSLYRVLARTAEAMQSTFKEDVRSTDVLYSLFSWGEADINDLFDAYKESAADRAAEAPAETYYPSSLTARYDTPLSKAHDMPPTGWGKAFSRMTGFDLEDFNYTFRQLSAKFLQLFMLIGALVVLYKRSWFIKTPHLEFVLIGAGSLVMLSAIIVLPVLSVEYGLLRAFQQSLMFLGICIVIGSASIFAFLPERSRLIGAGTLAILFFLSSTGVFTQLLGGYDAQLHLNNAGTYYDLYYVHESELEAITWLSGQVQKDALRGIETTIQGDHYALEAAPALQRAYVINDIYPALIRRDAYVFLGVSNVRTGEATASYNQTSISYRYPIEFLEETKSLVYDNGAVKIYR